MNNDGLKVQGTPIGSTNGRSSETSEKFKDSHDASKDSTGEAIRDLVTYARELVVSTLFFTGLDEELTLA